MTTTLGKATPQLVQAEWIPFAGGELEGRRPRALCTNCRAQLQKRVSGHTGRGGVTATPLCFECYRAEIDRERAVKAAGEFDTASVERFQFALPLPAVNRARLARLKVERHDARRAQAVASPFVDRRHRAQINARHALQRIAEGLRSYRAKNGQRAIASASAQELTLPEAWLPFVASR